MGPLKCLRRRTNHQPWPSATFCPHKLTLTASFSPSGFRGRLAGPPLLVTAVHLSRRMAIADWLVRCVHIFDDRQRIFKKSSSGASRLFTLRLGGHGTAGTGRPANAPPPNRGFSFDSTDRTWPALGASEMRRDLATQTLTSSSEWYILLMRSRCVDEATPEHVKPTALTPSMNPNRCAPAPTAMPPPSASSARS